jgi:hypothetical protein
MTQVHFHISMSLDGFVTGPNEGVGNPLGDDDGRLHDWMFDAKTEANAEILDEVYGRTGAILMGKRCSRSGSQPEGRPRGRGADQGREVQVPGAGGDSRGKAGALADDGRLLPALRRVPAADEREIPVIVLERVD